MFQILVTKLYKLVTSSLCFVTTAGTLEKKKKIRTRVVLLVNVKPWCRLRDVRAPK